MRILIISMCYPYQNAKDAGSKVVNYNINQLLKDNNDLTLISLVTKEQENITIDNRIDNNKILYKKNKDFFHVLLRHNPFNKYGNEIDKDNIKEVLKILHVKKENGYYPDIVILEWTYIALYMQNIKRIFPKSKYIVSEQDVTFLGLYRKYRKENNLIKCVYKYIYYLNIKKHELRIVKDSDLTVVYNKKDEQLLINNNIESKKIVFIPPFYDSYNYKIQKDFNNILFFGAMNRYENHEAAMWFIKNVMPYINKNIKFVVIGNKPNKELINCNSKRIVVKGFVDDVEECIKDSKIKLFVCPLHYGAGIKIKILEMMNAGVPTMTGLVGIEGIYAENGRDFFFCETATDYIKTINEVFNNKYDLNTISSSSKQFIKENFNLEQASINYINALHSVVNNNFLK